MGRQYAPATREKPCLRVPAPSSALARIADQRVAGKRSCEDISRMDFTGQPTSRAGRILPSAAGGCTSRDEKSLDRCAPGRRAASLTGASHPFLDGSARGSLPYHERTRLAIEADVEAAGRQRGNERKQLDAAMYRYRHPAWIAVNSVDRHDLPASLAANSRRHAGVVAISVPVASIILDAYSGCLPDTRG